MTDSAPRLTRRAAVVAGLATLATPALAEIRNNVVIGLDGWLYAAWENIRRIDVARGRQVTTLINQAVGVMREAGIEVALTLAPTRARIYPEFLPPDFQPSPDADRRYALVLEELRRSGAVVPDFATLLAGLRRSQQEAVFFKADTHWTAIGAEAAATDLAKAVKEKLQLPASRRPGTRLGGFLTNVHSGDFLALLPENERGRYPAERFRIRQAAAMSGGGSVAGGLLEDDNADVMVVGNSYMQPYFGFPQVLSNQLARPVGLIWKTARFGPYHTLLEYLGGNQFKAQRPKLLVWHLMEGSMEQLPDAANWWESAAVMPPARFISELRTLVGRR